MQDRSADCGVRGADAGSTKPKKIKIIAKQMKLKKKANSKVHTQIQLKNTSKI